MGGVSEGDTNLQAFKVDYLTNILSAVQNLLDNNNNSNIDKKTTRDLVSFRDEIINTIERQIMSNNE